MKKRFLAFVLPIILLLTALAGQRSADAAGSAQTELSLPVQEGDLVCYGGSASDPLVWLVLDASSDSAGAPGLFLLSNQIQQLFGLRFDSKSSAWSGSGAEAWCEDFYSSSFSDREKACIVDTSKSEGGFDGFDLSWQSSLLSGAHVFFLSAKELGDYLPSGNYTAYAADGSVGYYWLRSMTSQGEVGLVRDENRVGSSEGGEAWGARPAINLSADRILFALPAGEVMELGRYTSLSGNAGQTWKLACLDESRSLRIGEAALDGDMLSLPYYGASVGEHEYLSLLVRDAEGQACGYERLLKPDMADGTVSIDMAAIGMPADGRLYLFSEHDGGAFASNAASAACEVCCRLYIDTGDLESEPDPIVAPFGATISLPDSMFLPQRGQEFDHWELNGVPVDEDFTLTGSSVLKAIYRGSEASSIEFDKPRLVLMLFEEQEVRANIVPAGAVVDEITWSVGDESLVKLTDNGDGSCTLKALRPGETVLTARSGDGDLSSEVSLSVIGSGFRAWIRNNIILIIILAAAALAVALYFTFDKSVRRRRRHRHRHHHHHHHNGSSSSAK